MIVFDLACAPAGHVFEAWFGSTDDYEAQRRRGLVSCPLCGAADVDKAVMAPRVGAKGNRAVALQPATQPAAVPCAQTVPPEAAKAMLRALAEAQARILAKSDYVGDSFAREARAIHLGESDHRPIHGSASLDDARGLIEDGIAIAPLPLPMRPPGSDN